MSRNNSDITSPDPSASEFLTTLEESGVLSETKVRAIRGELAGVERSLDSTTLAGQLVEQGRLTEFQAKRLLHGRSEGLVLGRYVLLERIGVGAMGRVFKARHRLMDRAVALKVVLPECVASRNTVARFLREMKIVGLLDHPNVVRAFDADQYGDSPYIVMEYLEGEDLERTVRLRGALPVDLVIDYAAQTAWGLAHAHEKGIIHRDVKPTNLFLVSSTGVVKVLDLGLGAFVGVSQSKTKPLDTDEGFVVGTTDYMSPEQVSGEPIDARTDLFSLGCTMYRLLTGGFAFPGQTQMDRLVRRMQGPHVPITELRRGLPYRLVDTLDQLLALNPDDRFSDAVDVAEALESLLPASERPSQRTAQRIGVVPSSRRAPGTRSSVPEPPLDWSLVESALRPIRAASPEAEPPLGQRARLSPQAPPPRLDHHRRHLEESGAESGRSAQREYRKEVIKLNRELAELKAQDAAERAPAH
ncbi:MAG: serine/threonine-protein kinase [Isosphaeraceae bacterium]